MAHSGNAAERGLLGLGCLAIHARSCRVPLRPIGHHPCRHGRRSDRAGTSRCNGHAGGCDTGLARELTTAPMHVRAHGGESAVHDPRQGGWLQRCCAQHLPRSERINVGVLDTRPRRRRRAIVATAQGTSSDAELTLDALTPTQLETLGARGRDVVSIFRRSRSVLSAGPGALGGGFGTTHLNIGEIRGTMDSMAVRRSAEQRPGQPRFRQHDDFDAIGEVSVQLNNDLAEHRQQRLRRRQHRHPVARATIAGTAYCPAGTSHRRQ